MAPAPAQKAAQTRASRIQASAPRTRSQSRSRRKNPRPATAPSRAPSRARRRGDDAVAASRRANAGTASQPPRRSYGGNASARSTPASAATSTRRPRCVRRVAGAGAGVPGAGVTNPSSPVAGCAARLVSVAVGSSGPAGLHFRSEGSGLRPVPRAICRITPHPRWIPPHVARSDTTAGAGHRRVQPGTTTVPRAVVTSKGSGRTCGRARPSVGAAAAHHAGGELQLPAAPALTDEGRGHLDDVATADRGQELHGGVRGEQPLVTVDADAQLGRDVAEQRQHVGAVDEVAGVVSVAVWDVPAVGDRRGRRSSDRRRSGRLVPVPAPLGALLASGSITAPPPPDGGPGRTPPRRASSRDRRSDPRRAPPRMPRRSVARRGSPAVAARPGTPRAGRP